MRESELRCTVLLEREPDGGYVVSVPVLPDCISQGNSRAEALENIREAIDLYIEDCRDIGDSVPTQANSEFVEVVWT
jgi:predicted RNase H-like HicB family nuclease